MLIFLIRLCNAAYQVGTGIADVTGPAAEVFLVTYNIFFLFFSSFDGSFSCA